MAIDFWGEKIVDGTRRTVITKVHSTNIGYEAEIFAGDMKPIHTVSGPDSEELSCFLNRIEAVCRVSHLRRER